MLMVGNSGKLYLYMEQEVDPEDSIIKLRSWSRRHSAPQSAETAMKFICAKCGKILHTYMCSSNRNLTPQVLCIFKELLCIYRLCMFTLGRGLSLPSQVPKDAAAHIAPVLPRPLYGAVYFNVFCSQPSWFRQQSWSYQQYLWSSSMKYLY